MRTPDYEREGVKLFLGDCLDILPEWEAESVDAVVTDPPYLIANKWSNIRVTRSGAEKGVRILSFGFDVSADPEKIALGFSGAISACKRSSAVWCFTGFDILERMRDAMRSRGFVVKPAAWVKKCPPPAGKGNWWPSGFELALYGYRHSPWFGDTDPKRSNVFVYDSYRYGQPGKVNHPTQKSIRLMIRIVSSIVPPNGSCIDPYMGSGSAGVACIRTGRKFIGIELDPRHFATAVKRIEREFNRTPLFDEQEPKKIQSVILEAAGLCERIHYGSG